MLFDYSGYKRKTYRDHPTSRGDRVHSSSMFIKSIKREGKTPLSREKTGVATGRCNNR